MQSIPVAVDKNQSDSGPVSVNPHLPLTVSVDGEFSPVNALADSQMLQCRPGVSNIVHNYDRCSVIVIQSYVSTFAMSEREQLQMLCVNVEDCKAQSGAIPYKAVSEIVCSSELHSCDIFSKPPPDVIHVFMLSENILKDCAGYRESIEIEKHVTKLLNSGMIERVISPWSSPVLTVIKKDGKTRFV